jgi:hypothetical protein
MVRKLRANCYVREIAEKLSELSARSLWDSSPWQLRCSQCNSMIFQPSTPDEEKPNSFELLGQEHKVDEGDPCDLLTDTGITLMVPGDVATQMVNDYKEVTLIQSLRYLSPHLTPEQSVDIPDWTTAE